MRALAWVVLLTTAAAQAEIIDRIAVAVGKQVITEQQIIEEIRVTAFLNRQPVVIQPEEKRKAAERLVEQTLMRRDMDLTHYPLPARPEAEKALEEVRDRYSPRTRFDEELRKYGITVDQLREHLWWQLTILRFIDYRFRPAIQIQESEITSYYEKKRVEWEQQKLAKIPTLEESRADIERILTDERVDQAVDRWVGDARTSLDILYHEEAFR